MSMRMARFQKHAHAAAKCYCPAARNGVALEGATLYNREGAIPAPICIINAGIIRVVALHHYYISAKKKGNF